MKKRIIALGLLWCLSAVMLQAARVDTVLVRSAAMNKDVKVVYVLPDKAIGKQACPVVYLLHGYGGNARSWVQLKPELPQMADEKGIIFVCPDGKNSWYWDSPENPAYRYETFVTSELVKYTDGNYATIPDRKARAISGLSMGGHGALWSAIRHKDVFGAAGRYEWRSGYTAVPPELGNEQAVGRVCCQQGILGCAYGGQPAG